MGDFPSPLCRLGFSEATAGDLAVGESRRPTASPTLPLAGDFVRELLGVSLAWLAPGASLYSSGSRNSSRSFNGWN